MPRALEGSSILAKLTTKRRWSAVEARAVIDLQGAPGLGLEHFAAAQGIDPQRLRRWRAQLSEGAPPSFVELTRLPVLASAPAIEVQLRSGCVVRVRDGFSVETLRRVVAALDQESPEC